MNDRFPFPRTDRRAAVGALAAELGHDLQGPLNLFRLTTDRLGRGQALDDEDVSLLREELDRLSALSTRLRGLSRASLQKVTASPQQLVDLALDNSALGLRSILNPQSSVFDVDLAAGHDLRIACDPALFAQALSELIANALEAKTTRAGVRFAAGAAPGFCVWDDGSGFELSAEQSLRWGTTTRPPASGLGLTVALRAARAHGFNLDLRRVAPFTEAWLLIPTTDVTRASAEAET